MSCRKILVANAKGGSGKSTLVCNLAAFYARQGKKVCIYDHDDQGSALRWLEKRDQVLPLIQGVDATRQKAQSVTRSWWLRQALDLDVAITDTPAGMAVDELLGLASEDQAILVPVLPSPIDIEAAESFIADLSRHQRSYGRQVRIAVVANRMRRNTRMSRRLERFMSGLSVPFVGRLRDTQYYVQAFAHGLGIHDIGGQQVADDQRHWLAMHRWLENSPRSETAENPVYASF